MTIKDDEIKGASVLSVLTLASLSVKLSSLFEVVFTMLLSVVWY